MSPIDQNTFVNKNIQKDIETARKLYDSRHYKEALDIYLRCSAAHELHGEYCRMGWLYEFGKGVPKDMQQAEYWYTRASESGLPDGYYYLGCLRQRSRKTSQAKDLMEKAASLGFAPAMFQLGYMYKNGIDTAVDFEKAYKYFKAASDKGHVFAKRQIIEGYVRGEHGFWGRITGLFSVIKLSWQSFSLYRKNPSDIRLMGFCQ
jgi:TPR repeat protein